MNKKIMNILLLVVLVLSLAFNIKNLNKEENNKSSSKNKYIVLKQFTEMDSFEKINETNYNLNSDNYLFLGDSITDFYDLDKYYKDLPVVNSGIDGNKAYDIINNMKERVYNYNPSKVFLLIGTNQIWRQSEEEVYDSIIKIVEEIRKNRPRTNIYVESIYPVNKNMDSKMVKSRDNNKITKVNKKLSKYCYKKDKVFYIDLYSYLEDENGNLKEEYSTDGLHLSDQGYEIVTNVIKKYM